MRYPGLDLLRAIAIVWVMLFHSYMVGGLGPWGDAFARHGWMGVDLFFVLSGFLIGQQVLAPLSRGEPLRFGDFYLRRALRILPAFWVMLALYLLWPGIREQPLMEPWWKFVFFLFNVLHTNGNDAFAQVWSLCVEEHFYLVFPLLAWALSGRLTVRGFVTLCAVLVAGGVVLRAGIWIHDAMEQVNRGSDRADWFGQDLYYPTWNRLDGLLAGVCLAALRVYRPARWAALQRHANGALLLGLVLLGASLACFWSRLSPVGNSIGWPLLSAAMALLVFAGASPRSWIGARALPGAAWLAAVSYSLYLTHTAASGVLHRQAGAWLDGHGLATFAAYAAVTLLAGATLHYAVERPGLKLRDRWLRSRAAPSTPAAAVSPGAASPRAD
ncbi:Peptidoglycan/LPS O-acetylase OafA/YrhL, contains acyltransferase and SGNH-hydrolase domains [Pseudoxanthomonas sp. GM95]|uniref:acyltransferase family protein n=1 Tax=Pseudoxanthomonas sp. GM95 TaxID=1881043 RepID=UPI0008CFF3FB|nr:acyltransferase [Pseudoxanthomonas sp. GM95]SEM35359.1 Peptidoglycan/LPS O-acetylase OafA/YrhL, contains acyltransferase and SGNH-hydrolase domains [Pseudoxanthomonas sp. GM95]